MIRSLLAKIIKVKIMETHQKMDPTIIKRIKEIPVPTITATLFELDIRNSFLAGIRPLNPNNSRFVGTAVTMRAVPTREDIAARIKSGSQPNLHRKLIYEACEGEVIVTDCGGEPGISFFGELISTYLSNKGVEAIVTDAGMADVVDVAKIDIPIFCQGSAPIPAPSKAIIMDINCPINFLGVTVMPGDLLAGDENGVAVIPRSLASELAEAAREKELLEKFLLQKLKNGAELEGTYPPNQQTLAEYRNSTNIKT